MVPFLQGKVLLASPLIGDGFFHRTIVLILRHEEDGAMGLVLNRPSAVPLSAVLSEPLPGPMGDAPIYRGGPCDGPLMVLHGKERDDEAGVVAGVGVAVDGDAIRELAERNAGPMKFFAGYAGWTTGQLESEISQKAWRVVSADASLILSELSTDAWRDLWEKGATGGVKFQNVPESLIPDDPSVN